MFHRRSDRTEPASRSSPVLSYHPYYIGTSDFQVIMRSCPPSDEASAKIPPRHSKGFLLHRMFRLRLPHRCFPFRLLLPPHWYLPLRPPLGYGGSHHGAVGLRRRAQFPRRHSVALWAGKVSRAFAGTVFTSLTARLREGSLQSTSACRVVPAAPPHVQARAQKAPAPLCRPCA